MVTDGARRAARAADPCPCGAGRAEAYALRPNADGVRCLTCGLLARRPLPSEAELRRHYRQRYWTRYADEQSGTARENVYRRALEWIERYRRPPGLLVDVGCGPGALLAQGRERHWRVSGLDPSFAAVLEARQRGLDAVEGTWPDSPLSGGSADVVTLVNVLDHLRDPLRALEEAGRVLKPGGLLYLRLPNGPLHARLSRLLERLGGDGLAVFHLYGFGPRALRHYLVLAGFSVLGVRAAPPSEGDAYGAATAGRAFIRHLLRQLSRLAHPVSRWTGLDRRGWGASLEALAVKDHQPREPAA